MENYHGNYAEGMTTRGNTDSYLPRENGLLGHHRSRRSDASTPWEMFAEFSGTINNRRSESDWNEGEHMFYRGQPRTASGRYRRMMRRSRQFEENKEHIADMLAEQCDPESLLDKAIKEAGEFVTYAASGKPFEAMKEFAELAILVCAISEHLPEDLTEAAEMEALDYYERKIEHSRYGHSMDRNPLYDHKRHR